MPTLRVFAGASEHDLRPIEANVSTGHPVSSDAFEGNLAVFLRMDGQEPLSYFTTREKTERDPSWSIQFQGRFLQQQSADQLYIACKFANKLDLPWGISAAMQFVRWVDPTLVDDLYAKQPWLLSPLLSSVSYLRLEKLEGEPPAFSPSEPMSEDCTLFDAPADSVKRKKHFHSADKRAAVTLGPKVLVQGDLVHGHMRFPSLKLHFPGGIEFNSTHYWNEDQRFMVVCCDKSPEGGPGRTFWCIAFEIEKDST